MKKEYSPIYYIEVTYQISKESFERKTRFPERSENIMINAYQKPSEKFVKFKDERIINGIIFIDKIKPNKKIKLKKIEILNYLGNGTR